MYFDYKELEEKSISLLENNKSIIYITHLASLLPCSRCTFYEKGLDKSDTIKEKLEENRVLASTIMMSNWTKPEASPTLQKLAMSFLSSDEDIRRMTRIDRDIPNEKGFSGVKTVVVKAEGVSKEYIIEKETEENKK